MIVKERLKILFIIITLVLRAECDFLDELNVALQTLQHTVDKISLENAKTNEKVEKLQSDLTIMIEANSKSFENVNELQAETSEKIDQLNKKIQNIEIKVDAADDSLVLVRTKIDDVDNMLEENNNILNKLENDAQTLSFETNLSIADLDNKLSTL